MVVFPIQGRFIKAAAGRQINFTTDDGQNPMFFGFSIKIHRAVQYPVVGDGYGSLPQSFGFEKNLVNAAGTV